jgi:hypothetical protein
MVTCIKCGSSFARTRFNGRAKYCDNCSPNKPARNMPELVCCHCRTVYGHAKRRNKSQLDSEPCPKCYDIVKRKRKAEIIRLERGIKKRWSRFGKHLLLMEEEAAIFNDKKTGYFIEDHLFTRMRYVSADELRDCSNTKTQKYGGIPIFRNTGWTDNIDYWICEPGFHRVEPLIERNYLGQGYFTSVCAGGIPSCTRNRYREMLDERLSEGIAKGRKIEEEIRYKKIVKAMEQERIERRNEINKKHWRKKAIQTNDVQFFRTFALVGAIQQKAQSA